MTSAALALRGVSFGYRRTPVFAGLDLAVDRGTLCAILGPNGSGKTTFVRLACGAVRPESGSIEIAGSDLARLAPRERARRVAVVPQETHPVFDFTVLEYVRMGRAPHLGFLGIESDSDLAIARHALRRTDVDALADRLVRALSGGERQRVLVARALAQQAPLLLLDEPTAFLDLRHRLMLYETIGRLVRHEGMTVVLVSHDVNLAARFCDRLVLLRRGAIAADGSPDEVLCAAAMRDVYDVDADVRIDPITGRPYVVPLSPRVAP